MHNKSLENNELQNQLSLVMTEHIDRFTFFWLKKLHYL